MRSTDFCVVAMLVLLHDIYAYGATKQTIIYARIDTFTKMHAII